MSMGTKLLALPPPSLLGTAASCRLTLHFHGITSSNRLHAWAKIHIPILGAKTLYWRYPFPIPRNRSCRPTLHVHGIVRSESLHAGAEVPLLGPRRPLLLYTLPPPRNSPAACLTHNLQRPSSSNVSTLGLCTLKGPQPGARSHLKGRHAGARSCFKSLLDGARVLVKGLHDRPR